MTARSLLGAATLAAVALPACSTPQVYEKPLTPVTVSRVEAFTTGTAVRYSATVKPALEVGVAFKVGGYIDELLSVRDDRGRERTVQEGDRVTKGAALARVRPSDYQQRVAEARSGLAEATAMHESARLDFERASRLYERHSLTKPEHDGARARIDGATAKVEGARAALTETQNLLDDDMVTVVSRAAPVQASVPAIPAGGSYVVTMARVQVLNLETGGGYTGPDLTGTLVTSDRRTTLPALTARTRGTPPARPMGNA